MDAVLCITIRYLQPFAHGRGDTGEPEWPPSPLRMFQALIAASAGRWNQRDVIVFAVPAIEWLESLPPPQIVAATGTPSLSPYRLYVPDNTTDIAAKAWLRGRDEIVSRTDKDTCPTHLVDDAIHYLYPIDAPDSYIESNIAAISLAARSITHLGWGIDMAFGDAKRITSQQANELSGNRWNTSATGTAYRTPRIGSLKDLMRKHTGTLHRFGADGARPVPPLCAFQITQYRIASDVIAPPHAVFKLLDDNDDTYRHPHSKLIHIAGMIRHVAIDAMKRNPPRGVIDPETWVERYVAGHRDKADARLNAVHSQLSYIPLPSMGHPHTDPGVRRLMIVAPIGDDAILEHVARQLDGMQLRPENPADLPGPVFLQRVRHDNIAGFYTRASNAWASFTPVILPGHDDHKSDKTHKLIEKALAQSGIEQACEFQWSPFSQFPKSYSAHKYNKFKQLAGYIRPDHLQNLTSVHLVLKFSHPVPGPLAIGAGRHCGFGLMAAAAP